jgi:uncharacterized surface protein with fasciclin (FAS1) repeats
LGAFDFVARESAGFNFAIFAPLAQGEIMRHFKPIIVALGLAAATLGGCSTSGKEMATSAPIESRDIVDTAVAAGSFNTLVTAVKQAGLVETLKGKGPFTVFAPTDAAFAKIPKDRLDALLADKALLTKVLTYHVVPGRVMAANVKPGPVKTVEGDNLTVSVQGSQVMVDQATVIKTDIAASNGVIHVIDSVVVPN